MTRTEAIKHLCDIQIHSGYALPDDESKALTLAIAALSGTSVDEIQEYCRHHYDDQSKYFDDDHCRGAAQAYWNVMRRIEEGR